MLTRPDACEIARARLKDADVLLQGERYDGAVYVCGYAVEIAIKAKICKTLGWSGYPSTNAEFDKFKSFRTHNLDDLLHLCGIEQKIKTERLADWSFVQQWNPEARYRPIGSATAEDAKNMIDSAQQLLEMLLWEILT